MKTIYDPSDVIPKSDFCPVETSGEFYTKDHQPEKFRRIHKHGEQMALIYDSGHTILLDTTERRVNEKRTPFPSYEEALKYVEGMYVLVWGEHE